MTKTTEIILAILILTTLYWIYVGIVIMRQGEGETSLDGQRSDIERLLKDKQRYEEAFRELSN